MTKCVQITATKEITRVSDSEGESLVRAGKAQFVPQQLFRAVSLGIPEFEARKLMASGKQDALAGLIKARREKKPARAENPEPEKPRTQQESEAEKKAQERKNARREQNRRNRDEARGRIAPRPERG